MLVQMTPHFRLCIPAHAADFGVLNTGTVSCSCCGTVSLWRNGKFVHHTPPHTPHSAIHHPSLPGVFDATMSSVEVSRFFALGWTGAWWGGSFVLRHRPLWTALGSKVIHHRQQHTPPCTQDTTIPHHTSPYTTLHPINHHTPP